MVDFATNPSPGGLVETANCAVADIESTSDVHERFSGLSSTNGFPSLMRRKLWPSAQLNAVCLCSSASLPSPYSDQFAFELGEATQHGQHQSAVRGGRIRPCITKRTKADPLISNRSKDVEKISGGYLIPHLSNL